jgi:hypothetical protein
MGARLCRTLAFVDNRWAAIAASQTESISRADKSACFLTVEMTVKRHDKDKEVQCL